MADQAVNTLPKRTTVEDTDALLMIGAAEEYQIDYSKLADAVLNKLKSKTFELDQGTKSLPVALNELNSKTLSRVSVRDTPLDLDKFTDITKQACWDYSGCKYVNQSGENINSCAGTVIVLENLTGCTQVFLDYSNIYLKIRTKYADSWCDWHTITTSNYGKLL